MAKPGGKSRFIQPDEMLVDGHGRMLNYLRVSLTDRCNFRCIYCMPPSGVDKIPHDDILSLEEIARVARVAVAMGVDKIRLTGGEPLLRRNLPVLLDKLSSIQPRPDIRLTTNGFFLSAALPWLLAGGVSAVNVSLDTLRPDRFAAISGLPPQAGPRALDAVLGGIRAAVAQGGLRVKVNTVPLAGLNDDEVADFARLAAQLGVAVRFIEYMPVGRLTRYRPERFISSDEVLGRLAALGSLAAIDHDPADGPAQRFALPGGRGEVGVISAISSHFCATCNRLRLTADGRLAPCLFSDETIALRPTLRAGVDDRQISALLALAARRKPSRHQHQPADVAATGCQMSNLGG